MNLGQNICGELKRLYLFRDILREVENDALDQANSLTTEAMFIHTQISVSIPTILAK